jgi:hypothetical protein
MPPLIRATLPATPQAEPYPVAPHLLPHPHKAQTRHPEPSHHASVHPSTHPKARPRLLPLTPRTHTLGSGQPLAAHIQNAIEHSLHVDLSSVRVHHDHVAQAKAMQLSARAFTYGHDIFLGPGEHPHDLPLLAHEAAHVVQQQAAASPQAWSTGSTFASNNHFEHEAVQASSAVQRGESFNVQQRVSTPSVQRLGISDALDYFAGAANNLPGFSMLTVVIGFNPINMANVERSPANILRAVVEFIPGGHQVTEALNKYGVFEKVGNWIADQLKALGDIGHALHVALDKFLDSLSWKDIFHLGDLWDRFVTTFTAPIDRIKSFLGGLVTGIWDLVRPLILKPLAALAESVGAWPLLCAVMGKNPITGEKVDSSADALIGGFMHLIGQDEIYTNIKKANAGARALAWFKTAMSGMVALVSSIPDRFMALVKSFEWSDILDLPSGFRKVASAFGSFAKDFFTWAGTTIWDLLQIIFEVVAPAVMPYLQKLGASFKSILKNPMGFVRNLVAAGKLGFQMFWQRFGEHLKKGFIEWLTGSMPGIYIPRAFTLEEIVKFVLSVLGLTWANIRGKLVKVIGETAVVAMEKGFAIVQTLVKDGPAAAWEQIKGELGNLRDMVLQAVMSFLVETVISKAVEKLASLLVPAAAFIQAILSIYNTIMVFVQKLAKIIQVVKAFLDGMMEIAAGSIGGAAAKVESTLAGLLALSINFLAGFLGLNNVAAKVMGIINDKVRAPIDKALDKAIAWIVAMAKKLFASGKAVVAGIVAWWKSRKSFTDTGGTSHSLYFTGEAASANLTVASTPTPVNAFLASIQAAVADSNVANVKAAYAQATTLAGRINLLKTKVESGTPPRQPADIDALNAALEAMAPLLAPLAPLAFPPVPPAALAVNKLVKIAAGGSIAVITAIDTGPPGLVHFDVIRPGTKRSKITALMASKFGTLFTEHTDDPRELYLGPTPDKDSSVGTAVKARMKAEMKYDIPGHAGQAFSTRTGKWVAESECDMGHVIDAVLWWNSNGRLTGAQSGAVKAFMTAPINYELEPSSINRSRGAAVGASNRYLPPLV